MARAKPSQLVACESFACEVNGHELIVHAGDVVDAGHPAAGKGREHLFRPAGEHDPLPVPAPPRRTPRRRRAS
jgi:hypothetical protein